MTIWWLLALIIALLTLVSFRWIFAPYFPTRQKDLQTVHTLAGLQNDEVFYELGCGDAKVSHHIARHNPQARIIGFELFWPVYLIAKIRSILSFRSNFTVRFKNIFWTDLSDGDVVYLFGMKDGLNQRLSHKLQKELKPGSRVISYVFALKDWPKKPKIMQIKGQKTKIYRYEV